jgi:hypothetical protein
MSTASRGQNTITHSTNIDRGVNLCYEDVSWRGLVVGDFRGRSMVVVRRELSSGAEAHFVGFVYVGTRKREPTQGKPEPASESGRYKLGEGKADPSHRSQKSASGFGMTNLGGARERKHETKAPATVRGLYTG